MNVNTARALFVTALVIAGAVTLRAQNPDHLQQLLTTRACAGCDLRAVQLVRQNLNRADLTGADFTGAFLYGTTFKNAQLKNAKFADADLKGADLSDASDADLTGAITDETTTCPNRRPGPCSK